MKRPLRTLDHIFSGRIIPISERIPFVHVFDDYNQAIYYVHNSLSEEERAQVLKRIGELPPKGKKEIEQDIEMIKQEAARLNFTNAQEHIQHAKEDVERSKERLINKLGFNPFEPSF